MVSQHSFSCLSNELQLQLLFHYMIREHTTGSIWFLWSDAFHQFQNLAQLEAKYWSSPVKARINTPHTPWIIQSNSRARQTVKSHLSNLQLHYFDLQHHVFKVLPKLFNIGLKSYFITKITLPKKWRLLKHSVLIHINHHHHHKLYLARGGKSLRSPVGALSPGPPRSGGLAQSAAAGPRALCQIGPPPRRKRWGEGMGVIPFPRGWWHSI